MLELVREAKVGAMPASAKTRKQQARVLAKPNTAFHAVNPDGSPHGIVHNKKNLILGHKDSASSLFNSSRHKFPRLENQALNKKRRLYQGLEPKSLSAASGSQEDRYEDPGPYKGSHRSYFAPDHEGYNFQSPFPQYKVLRKPGDTSELPPGPEPTLVPWSYSTTDQSGNVTFLGQATHISDLDDLAVPSPVATSHFHGSLDLETTRESSINSTLSLRLAPPSPNASLQAASAPASLSLSDTVHPSGHTPLEGRKKSSRVKRAREWEYPYESDEDSNGSDDNWLPIHKT